MKLKWADIIEGVAQMAFLWSVSPAKKENENDFLRRQKLDSDADLWRCERVKTWRHEKSAVSENEASGSPLLQTPSDSQRLFLADGDGFQDHLLPVCLDAACQHSAIYLAKSGTTGGQNSSRKVCTRGIYFLKLALNPSSLRCFCLWPLLQQRCIIVDSSSCMMFVFRHPVRWPERRLKIKLFIISMNAVKGMNEWGFNTWNHS